MTELESSRNNTIRLNTFIASQLSIGRRQADVLIERGRVTVNGTRPTLGARITPAHDRVMVDRSFLPTQTTPTLTYLLFNKPVGYICSRRQQGDTKTIYALLPKRYHHLKPVGRLDKDSSGLLLLTNDGQLAHHLTHPKFSKIKRYEVTLDKPLAPLHYQLVNDHGIQLPDGPSKLQLERLAENDAHRWLATMHEGRNRQIRRTFAALGYTVTQLYRVQFGSLALEQLNGRLYQEIESKHLQR